MTHNAKVAIIMVTYNRADVTCLAFDALARAATSVPFKVFVIDNKSKKEERVRIQECFQHLTSKGLLNGEFIISDENLGFSGGNNLGLKAAFSDPSFTHICLLNNDTVVTPYWIERLLAHEPKGLLGPISNSVGNEQLVPVTYYGNSPDGYIREKVWEFSKNWYEDHQGQLVPSEMLGFFCVFGLKSTFEKIGLLDEQFGPGTFEDDDYCARAKESGFPLEIARDVFIHHWGSASFSKMGQKKLYRLMNKNRALFEKKHQTHWKSPISTLPLAYRAEIENHLKQKSGDPKRREETIHKYEKIIRGQTEWLFRPFDPLNPNRRKLALGLGLQLPSLPVRISKRIFKVPVYLSMYCRKPDFRNHANTKFRFAVGVTYRLFKKNFGKIRQTISPGKRNLICFPICPYYGRRQRPQQLIERVAEHFNHTFWVEPQSTTFNGILKADHGIQRVFLKGKIQNFYIDQVPAESSQEVDGILLGKLVPSGGHLVVVIQSLYWLGHVANLKKIAAQKKTQIKVIYDCMDHHTGFGSALYHNELHEQNIISISDVLIASSDKIASFLKQFGKPVYQIKNGCSIADFPLYENPPRKGKIGYFGAIAEWFDWDLVQSAAKALPHVQFELIGDYGTIRDKVKDCPSNISFMGERPFSELKHLTTEWDAALIPFIITPLIEATNPVKLYEYSSLGIPVISTPIPEVLSSSSDAQIVKNAGELAEAFAVVVQGDSPEKRRKRHEFALQNTWSTRAADFGRLLRLQ